MLDDAARLYRDALRQQPDNFTALHDFGVLLHQQGQNAEALMLLDQAALLDPRSADALTNRGIVQMALGQIEAAVVSFDQAIEAHPTHSPALFARGDALLRLERYEQALRSLDGAIAVDPTRPEAFNNRAAALRGLDRLDEALASLDQAVALRPDYAEAWCNHAMVLQVLTRHEEALVSFDRAVSLDPANAEAFNSRGAVLQSLDRAEDALASYDAALALQPELLTAQCNRAGALEELDRSEESLAIYGSVLARDSDYLPALIQQCTPLRSLNRLDEALASVERALELDPDNPDALSNRGSILVALKRPTEAFASYRRIIATRPDTPEAHFNLGVALQQLNRHDEAIAEYSEAIALRPDYVIAHFNRSLCRFAVGDFEHGWQDYEWRWQVKQLRKSKRDFAQPLWLGEDDIADKTILLHAEQGFGDTLQFCRYVPLVAARANVVLEVPGNMVRLMFTLDEGGQIVAAGESLPHFDLHCPLLSLPRAFGMTSATIPATVPYLRADPDLAAAWSKRIASLPGMRVGLVWSSGIRRHDRQLMAFALGKSMPLHELRPLGSVPGVSLISLQKGDGADEAASPPDGMVLHNWTDELHDFADTAALIDSLDLVISVDTAVAHLAGAMGKPVWLLNRFDSSWQWLPGPEDCLWYPTLRQFRQPAAGDWPGAVSHVAEALRALTADTKRAGLRPAPRFVSTD